MSTLDYNQSISYRKKPQERPAKHTPGPWEAINHTDALRTGEHIWDIRTPNGGVAAWIDDLCDSETKAANAKLIAAAPELLDALRDLQREIVEHFPSLKSLRDTKNLTVAGLGAAYLFAEEAIRKATE